MTAKRAFLAACCLLVVAVACVGPPKGISPVGNFDLDRYLGTWYEIARLDHRFERGLSNVTATYLRGKDGSIGVVNRGFNKETGKWETADGKALPSGAAGEGSLKVSFFGPFYGGYHIIALDRDSYRYAMVCGPNRSYLWILSREPRLPEKILDSLVMRADELGFSTGELIFVVHDRTEGEMP